MYIVKIKNGEKTIEIHNTKEKLKSGSIVKGINSIDSFSFTILPANIGFDYIFDLKTLVSVYDTRKNKYEFFGRVLYSHDAMSSDGLITKEVTCESYFGFLCDSVQKYVVEKNWTVSELLSHIIEQHNSQVEDYKKFVIGQVTVTDPNDNLYLGIQRENTWKTIEEKLINKLGGEIRYRVVGDAIYLDYLTEIGATLSTSIELSKNMKSITKEDDSTAYVSRLIPLGCKLQDEAGETTEERLDITSVNNGIEYIEDLTAKELYGIHYAYAEFDDVKDANNLLRKGREWLAENNKVHIKYSISALDLSLLGLDIDDFDIYNRYPIRNKLLGIDDIARIIKKTINICEETSSTIEIGDNFKTLTDIQIEQLSKINSISENVNKIESTTNDLNNKVTESYEELKQNIVEQTTTLTNTCESIILSALESYTESGDFESFKETVEAQLQILSDEINLKFTETVQYIENVDGDLQEKFNTITKYFTFDINGLTIGQTDSPYKVVIDNDRYSMLVNDIEVMWIANGEVHTPEITIEKKMNLFGYLIDQDAEGNVNCEWIGGD